MLATQVRQEDGVFYGLARECRADAFYERVAPIHRDLARAARLEPNAPGRAPAGRRR